MKKVSSEPIINVIKHGSPVYLAGVAVDNQALHARYPRIVFCRPFYKN